MGTKIPLAGVIGAPISHSKSPKLHGYWLNKYGIDGHYVHLHIEQSDLKDALAHMPKMGFVGANVTIPHKEAVLELADEVSDRAAMIGAANTLSFRPDGTIHADNTDGYGFIENLKAHSNWDPKAGAAVVLGAGGAARAVVYSLLEEGVREIRLLNRTRERAQALQSEFGARIIVEDWERVDLCLEGARTIVNTTSLGMVGNHDLTLSLDLLDADAVVTDLVYTPLETSLLRQAKARGCQTVDGLGMLLYQAAPGFERWFKHMPEVDEALRQHMLSS